MLWGTGRSHGSGTPSRNADKTLPQRTVRQGGKIGPVRVTILHLCVMVQPPEVDQQPKGYHGAAYGAELTILCGNTGPCRQGSWCALCAFHLSSVASPFYRLGLWPPGILAPSLASCTTFSVSAHACTRTHTHTQVQTTNREVCGV